MSNILKKITKKYKWLRFFNYKTTKLAVLSVALFGLCLSSGASFAKYRDENYGGGNAGAAKFGNVIIGDRDNYQQLPTSFESGNIHVFKIGFSISISNFEVKSFLTFDLRLSPKENIDFEYDYINLDSSFCLKNIDYVNNPNQFPLYTFSNGKQSKYDFKGDTSKNLSMNKYYVGTSDDGKAYTWSDIDFIDDNDLKKKGKINVFNYEIMPNTSLKKYFQVIIFVVPDYTTVGGKITDISFPETRILYNFDVTQSTIGGN